MWEEWDEEGDGDGEEGDWEYWSEEEDGLEPDPTVLDPGIIDRSIDWKQGGW